MNKLTNILAAVVMAPIGLLIKSESNLVRSALYAALSFISLMTFYAMLIAFSGIESFSTYKLYVVLIGMLLSIIIFSYISYLFSGLSRSPSQTRAFVAKTTQNIKDESQLEDVHNITLVVMLGLAGIVFSIACFINIIYIIIVGLGFRIVICNQGLGSAIILIAVIILFIIMNSRAIRSAYVSVIKPIAFKLHHT